MILRGEGAGLTATHWAAAVLYNGLARYEDALVAAKQASRPPEAMGYAHWSLVELVEAATRAGEQRVAAEALDALATTTRPSGTDWAVGIESRSRALLSDGTEAERLYVEAVARLDRAGTRAELARAHLLYGEWLRRERRRLDARQELRSAHEMFSTMGAEAFAARAARELLATGERAKKRGTDTRDDLTSQEAQIARLARDGLSNAEIGSRLFISPRTVEYHLHKVFGKLDIGSRQELQACAPACCLNGWRALFGDQRRGELRVRAGGSGTADVNNERISTARYRLLPPGCGTDSLGARRSSIGQIVDLSLRGGCCYRLSRPKGGIAVVCP